MICVGKSKYTLKIAGCKHDNTAIASVPIEFDKFNLDVQRAYNYKENSCAVFNSGCMYAQGKSNSTKPFQFGKGHIISLSLDMNCNGTNEI